MDTKRKNPATRPKVDELSSHPKKICPKFTSSAQEENAPPTDPPQPPHADIEIFLTGEALRNYHNLNAKSVIDERFIMFDDMSWYLLGNGARYAFIPKSCEVFLCEKCSR